MNAWIIAHKTDGAFLYSRGANGKVDLGATYGSYTFNGNTLLIKVDKSLDIEFPNREFGMIIDLTSDNTTGKEAMSMFTFKNGQFVHNTVLGAGGVNGMSSGEVASPIAAKKHIMFGYSTCCIYNPYKSVIMIGEETRNSWFL